MTISIGIFMFDKVEVLDFAGPFEVFTTAARVAKASQGENTRVFEVFTISRDGKPVKARGGLVVQPAYSFANQPLVDVLLIPGGVVSAELARPEVIQWIQRTNNGTQLTASVCTGAMLLGKAGLLDRLSATTHWEDTAELQSLFTKVKVVSGVRWVDQDAIVTSAGISAGIDMSLHLVERLVSRELAELTARQMEFDWTENR
ncbi:DJ-1/PfpI family protein [Halopseudomonas pelagia]|uniref:DJ-1/PfpI family protein n=1 Tax=Halopseudomonas pelagia TaxID=553151 RepID=UPI0030D7D0A2|tara:strand:- start:355 stop:960 length:606 start_codon:yes stop_codon:yes gene_type:complete